MSKRNCRVCGKPYTPCKNPRFDGAFNWKEVACSPECGEIYLQQILESRGLIPKKEEAVKVAKKSKKAKTKVDPVEQVDEPVAAEE